MSAKCKVYTYRLKYILVLNVNEYVKKQVWYDQALFNCLIEEHYSFCFIFWS